MLEPVPFVPLMPLPDAPPFAFRQAPSSLPVRCAHCSGRFALADGAWVSLRDGVADVVPDVVPDGVPDVVADGVPDVVADGVPDVVAEGVPDPVLDGAPDVVPDDVPDDMPDVVADVAPDAVPDVPVAAPAETANASAMAAASVHDPMCFMVDSFCLELATLDLADRRERLEYVAVAMPSKRSGDACSAGTRLPSCTTASNRQIGHVPRAIFPTRCATAGTARDGRHGTRWQARRATAGMVRDGRHGARLELHPRCAFQRA